MDQTKMAEVFGKQGKDFFYLMKMEALAQIMAENKIEHFKDGDLEIKRESLKLEQADSNYKIELERTKRSMRG